MRWRKFSWVSRWKALSGSSHKARQGDTTARTLWGKTSQPRPLSVTVIGRGFLCGSATGLVRVREGHQGRCAHGRIWISTGLVRVREGHPTERSIGPWSYA
jgi:hypothetical protein